jgi:hypothetical protein
MKKNYARSLNFFFLVAIFISFNISLFAQNAGINATGAIPNSSSILDLNTGNTFTNPSGKGLLIPNVALTATNASNPVTSPVTSLLVYNTATASSGSTAVFPGYYYWDGAKWVAFTGPSSSDWALLGNAGTSVTTNFLGTTDNVDLEFRANNVRSGLIDIANYQTFFGYSAGVNTTAAGTLNSFFGYSAGSGNIGGISNTGIGYNAIVANTAGNYNTAMGVQTLATTTGSFNSALGVNSGYSISSGNYNTALGFYAMNNFPAAAITGSYNTAVGYNSGINTTSGSYNTLLGYSSQISTSTFTNSTGVGSYSYPGASDVMVLGSIAGTNGAANSAKVGIGTTTPSDYLHVTVPAASGSNAIRADVSAGNGNGNAIYAVSTGVPNISTIYAEDTPTAAGSGFSISTSNHTIAGQIFGSQAYSFGVMGIMNLTTVNASGGVLGRVNSSSWGVVGYRGTGGAFYGVYGVNTATAYGSGVGARSSNPETPSILLEGTGIAGYGDLFGGWMRGNVYGMAVKGERVSLYVDGKTVVNQPVVELTRNENSTIVNYMPVSATADLQLHGIANLEKGIAYVSIDASTLNQFASTEDLTIIATPSGQTNGVYAQLRDGKLIIKENDNGTSNVKISWMIIGKRNIDPNYVPDEVKSKEYDGNLRDFMHDENDNSNIPSNLNWDGTKLNRVHPK